MTTYTCLCGRTVDADDEPSPGEPALCADCWRRRERDERLMREWYEDDDPEAVVA